MLYAKIKKENLLAISGLSAVLGEAVLKVDDEGIKIFGFNTSKTIMSDLTIKKDVFMNYKINPHAFTTSFVVNDLADVINRIKSDVVNLEIGETIKIMGTHNDREQEFVIPLMSNTTEQPSITLDFKKAIELDSGEFRDTIKDMALIGESFTIGVNETDDVCMFAQDNGKTSKIAIKPTKKGLVAFVTSEKIFSSYSNELLDSVMKMKISKKVNVFIGNQYPIKIQMIEKGIELNSVIAPRSADETQKPKAKVEPKKEEVKVEETDDDEE